jgi:hypothetical protein
MTLRYSPNGGIPLSGKCDLTRYRLATGTADFSGKAWTSGTIEAISVILFGDIWNSNSAATQLIQVVPDRG